MTANTPDRCKARAEHFTHLENNVRQCVLTVGHSGPHRVIAGDAWTTNTPDNYCGCVPYLGVLMHRPVCYAKQLAQIIEQANEIARLRHELAGWQQSERDARSELAAEVLGSGIDREEAQIRCGEWEDSNVRLAMFVSDHTDTINRERDLLQRELKAALDRIAVLEMSLAVAKDALEQYAQHTTLHSIRSNGDAVFSSPGPELAQQALAAIK